MLEVIIEHLYKIFTDLSELYTYIYIYIPVLYSAYKLRCAFKMNSSCFVNKYNLMLSTSSIVVVIVIHVVVICLFLLFISAFYCC